MNRPVYQLRPRNTSAIPNVVFALLIANGLIFALQKFYPPVNYWFSLWPIGSGNFYPWQLLTYGFLHATNNFYHIGFNMLALWMFGRDIEWQMGPQRFLAFWLVCVVGAAVVQLVVGEVTDSHVRTVGASGGVFGLLLAFAMAYPNRMIMLIFPPIPMRAKYFVLLYGLFTLYMGISGGGPSIAHFAHLGGMLFGYLMLVYWSRTSRR